MFHRTNKILVLACVAAIAFSLTSCAPEPNTAKNQQSSDKPSSSGQTSSGETTKNQDSISKEDTQLPEPERLTAESIDLSCEGIFTPQKIYEFDPNVYLVPSTLSVGSDIVNTQNQLGALNCDLVHPGLGITVQYSFTKLTESSAQTQQKNIASQTSSSFEVTRSIVGSFSTPTAQFVKNNYWVSVSSTNFQQPTDAAMWSNLAAGSL